jgi:hypothetical protein
MQDAIDSGGGKAKPARQGPAALLNVTAGNRRARHSS